MTGRHEAPAARVGHGAFAINHHPNRDADMRETLTSAWTHIQGFLFPMLREEVGPLTAQHERLVTVLDVARIEAFVQMWPGLPGRPPADRHALARAFVAKAVLNLPTTLALIDRSRARQRRAQGQLWRTDCAGTKSHQGLLPSHVWHPRIDHRAVDAAGCLNAAPAVRLALNRGKPQESCVQNGRRRLKKLQNR